MSKDCVMTSLPCMIVYLEVWITIEINLSSFIIQQTIENGLLDNVFIFRSIAFMWCSYRFVCHPSSKHKV